MSSGNQGFQFPVIEDFNSAKFNAVGDGDQEGDLIDVHDVASKLHVMAPFHDMGRDVDRSDLDSIGRLLNSLPFE